MKITNLSTAVAAAAVAAAAVLGTAPAAFGDASAVTTSSLGSAAKLNNGDVVQAWTVTDLKPSSDTIPYQVRGTLWELTATDEAIQGNVTPIVSNFNLRAADGQNYRALFQVATPLGVNPSTIAQGEKSTGKIYFDVTGPEPTTVVYNAGGRDLLVWDKPAASAPAPSGTSPSRSGTSSSPATAAPAAAAEAETEATPAPAAASTAEEGTEATPAGAGSRATDLPAATAAEAEAETEAETAPGTEETPAAPAPEGTTPVSLGAPLAEGTPAAEVAPEGAPAGASAGNVATAVPPAAPAEGAPVEAADPALVPAGVQPTTTVPAPAPTTAPVSHGPAA